MNRYFVAVVAGLMLLLSGCVAQVRGARVQQSLYSLPAGTRVALVTVDVPPWVEPPAKSEDPAGLLKGALYRAFAKSSLTWVDKTDSGHRVSIGPKVAPIIVSRFSAEAGVGQPWEATALAAGAPPITWRLVSGPTGCAIDPRSGRVTWTPGKTGTEQLLLAATNPFGETKLTHLVVVQEKLATQAPMAPASPFIAASVPFTAALPATLPADADLLLAAQLVSVSSAKDSMNRTRLSTDVVYTLWTRDGRELETTRVLLDGMPAAPFHQGVRFVPQRDRLYRWDDDSEERMRFASLEEEKLLGETLDASAAAFGFPYANHKIWFSAQLDDSSPLLKPGIELSNKDDYEGAFKAFQEVASSNPNLAGAYYNMGVMKEVLGHDEEAAELYKKALSLEDKGMYSRELSDVQYRLNGRKVIAPK